MFCGDSWISAAIDGVLATIYAPILLSTHSRPLNCRDPAAAELLQTVRSQLDVDSERAEEVERLMALVAATIERTQQETGACACMVYIT